LNGTVGVVHATGAFGSGAALNQDTSDNKQQGVEHEVRIGKIDALQTGQVSRDQQKIAMKAKLFSDIPAATALAMIYQAVGVALQNKTIMMLKSRVLLYVRLMKW